MLKVNSLVTAARTLSDSLTDRVLTVILSVLELSRTFFLYHCMSGGGTPVAVHWKTMSSVTLTT